MTDRLERLNRIAASIDLLVEHKPTRRVRGWPEKSQKPYGIYFTDGSHIASFADLDKLERNLRARAGC